MVASRWLVESACATFRLIHFPRYAPITRRPQEFRVSTLQAEACATGVAHAFSTTSGGQRLRLGAIARVWSLDHRYRLQAENPAFAMAAYLQRRRERRDGPRRCRQSVSATSVSLRKPCVY